MNASDLQRAWPALLLIAILALGAVLRFWGLGLESLWQDEIDSVLTARLSIAELLTEPIGNKQPLYFVLLHFWSQMFGESEASVRFPSALMGLLTVVATYGLGSLVGNRWTGLGAAFLVAISPVMLWYSQETRMYAFTSFLLVSSCFFMVKYLSAGRGRFLAAFALLTVLGLFTHYYYLPFVIALGAGGAIWLWRDGRRRDLRILLVTLALVLATLLPRIGVALQDIQNVESTSFTVSVGTLLVHLVGSIGLEQPQRAIAIWPLAVGVWSALALGLLWAWRLRQRGLLLTGATGLGSAAIMLIGATTIELPIVLRYFVPLVPMAYIIIAYGAGKIALQLGQRFSARVEPSYLYIAAALVMVAIVGGSATVSWADELEQTRKQQWREVATELEARAMEGDIFYIYPPRMLRHVMFYSPKAISTVIRTPLSQPTCGNGRVWVVGMRRSGGDDAVRLLLDQGCPAIESITFVGGINLNLLGAAAGVSSNEIIVTCNDLRPTIIGTDEDDLLRGTPGPDVIHGLNGNDTINGLGGDDVLCGGPGNDKLNGGEGNDVLLGGVGNDILNAGDGDDSLWGGPGDDVLNAGEGTDILMGGEGSDQLRGGVGEWPDRLEGGPGDDDLFGGPGDDILLGGEGVDSLNGGAGNDQCLEISLEDSVESCER